MRTSTRWWAALPLSAALLLAGCGDDATTDAGATGPASAPAATSGSTAPDEASTHGFDDVVFAGMMVPHHEQALEMAETVLAADGVDPAVRDLAEQIKAAQGPEIEQMTAWLESWGEAPAEADDHGEHGHHGPMPGIMTEEQMAALAAADGEEAGRLFLEMMIEHHEGAISMAEDELAKGTFAPARELAQAIIDAQRAEIEQMQALLAE